MEAVISFLSEYRLTGLTVGIFTFLIIGLFHPLVIKAEYWFGTRSWWMFLVLGIAAAALSVCVEGLVLSILFGVVAFSSFWSILEVFQQRERVRKGWFPENPRRNPDTVRFTRFAQAGARLLPPVPCTCRMGYYAASCSRRPAVRLW